MKPIEIGAICADPDFRPTQRVPRELSKKKQKRLREQEGGFAANGSLAALADKFNKSVEPRVRDKTDKSHNQSDWSK